MLIGTVAGAPLTQADVSKADVSKADVSKADGSKAMEQPLMKHFIDITVDFIRINFSDWSSKQSDDDLKKFIVTMIRFAREHDVRTEIGIQKLIAYKIIYKFTIPLSSQLDFILKRPTLDEESRLEYFERQFEDLSPLIKLPLEGAPERLP
jgi:hypothetical protein